MNTPRLPVPPRQSAWSGSKENIDHFGDSGITKLDKHADLKASHGKCVEAIHPAARQLQPAQHYPVPGHLSAHHTTAEPHAEPAPKRSVKPTPKQAAKRTHDVPSQATPPRVDIVSSAQPAQSMWRCIKKQQTSTDGSRDQDRLPAKRAVSAVVCRHACQHNRNHHWAAWRGKIKREQGHRYAWEGWQTSAKPTRPRPCV